MLVSICGLLCHGSLTTHRHHHGRRTSSCRRNSCTHLRIHCSCAMVLSHTACASVGFCPWFSFIGVFFLLNATMRLCPRFFSTCIATLLFNRVSATMIMCGLLRDSFSQLDTMNFRQRSNVTMVVPPPLTKPRTAVGSSLGVLLQFVVRFASGESLICVYGSLCTL